MDVFYEFYLVELTPSFSFIALYINTNVCIQLTNNLLYFQKTRTLKMLSYIMYIEFTSDSEQKMS